MIFRFRVEIYFLFILILGTFPGTYLSSYNLLTHLGEKIETASERNLKLLSSSEKLNIEVTGNQVKVTSTERKSSPEEKLQKEIDQKFDVLEKQTRRELEEVKSSLDQKDEWGQKKAEPLVLLSREALIREAYPISEAIESLIIWGGVLFLFLYNIPIRKVLRSQNCDQTIRKTAQRRILNITRIAFLLSWFVAIGTELNLLAFEYAHFGNLDPSQFTQYTISTLICALVCSALVLTWIEPHVLSWIPRVFSETEIFSPKEEGKSISLPTKFLMLVLTTSIIPLTVIFSVTILSNPAIEDLLELSARESSSQEWMRLIPYLIQGILTGGIMIFSMLVALSMNSSLRKSVITPLTMLVDRMKEVKRGNYEQHTTVYSNDEIGQLKSHFNEMLDGLKQREFMRDTFGKFLSPEISRKILEDQAINLGGEEAEATVLFLDIEKFTSLSESMTPTEVVSFLNSLFSELYEPIARNSGVINKYIGDCMMVLFGVPEKIPDHRDRAVQASIEMLQSLKQWNAKENRPTTEPLRIGIGIHT